MAPTNSDPATDLKQNAPHIRARPTRKDMNMNRWKTFTGALALFAMCSPAFAAVNIFACLPQWAALANELGGAKVSVYQASKALQDPHHIEARPSTSALMPSATLTISTASELE